MPRYLLDTNLLREILTQGSSLETYHRQYPNEIALSIVSVREALRGALASITDAESPQPKGKSPLSARYALLNDLLRGIQKLPVHLYSEQADKLYHNWSPAIRRIDPNDCRIAASAAVDGLVVLTRNVSDFERITAHESRVLFTSTPFHEDE